MMEHALEGDASDGVSRKASIATKREFIERYLQESVAGSATIPDANSTAGHNLAHAEGWKGKIARLVRRFVPRPDMVFIRQREQRIVDRFLAAATTEEARGTGAAAENVSGEALGDAPESGFVLNVGSGNITYGDRCVNLDIFEAENVDIVASSDAVPFPDEVFDGVMSLAVLEHVPDERAVLAECSRVLKPGGLCLHAVPFIQGFHGVPDDYRRLTTSGMRALLSDDFEEVECGVLLGPASGAAWILREFFAALTSFHSTLLYNAGMLFWGWVFWPLKFLDVFLASSPFAGQIASGVYYLGKKKGAPSSQG